MPASVHDFDVTYGNESPGAGMEIIVTQTATRGVCSECFGEVSKTISRLMSKRK